MPELKLIEPVSDWLELALETDLINPPLLRVKVKPLTGLDTMDAMVGGERKLSAISLSRALEAIAEWDLTREGKPLPCTPEVKQDLAPSLRLLLAQRVKSEKAYPVHAATVIQEYASEEENFLKK